MIDRILQALRGPPPARGAAMDDVRTAVAALLVEAARMDDCFSDPERSAIRRILAERYGLSQEDSGRLLAAAEHESDQSVQLYRFVRRVTDELSPADRIGLIEMMWEVAYADGELDPDEDALLRRVAGLVHVSDRERGEARRRVLARIATDR